MAAGDRAPARWAGGEVVTVDLVRVRERLSAQGQQAEPAAVAAALEWLGYLVSDASVLATLAELRRESRGAGLLDDLLALPGVTDVVVNGPGEVFVDRGEGLVPAGVRFNSCLLYTSRCV